MKLLSELLALCENEGTDWAEKLQASDLIKDVHAETHSANVNLYGTTTNGVKFIVSAVGPQAHLTVHGQDMGRVAAPADVLHVLKKIDADPEGWRKEQGI